MKDLFIINGPIADISGLLREVATNFFSKAQLETLRKHDELLAEVLAQIARLEKLIDRVALDFFKKKVTLKKSCLRDGNEKADKDGYGDEVMFVTSSSQKDRRPAVVDADKSTLVEGDARPYAGCYVNVSLRLYAYDHKVGGKGVAAGLLAIQFAKDGPAFGAAPVDTDSEFDDVSGAEDDAAFN